MTTRRPHTSQSITHKVEHESELEQQKASQFLKNLRLNRALSPPTGLPLKLETVRACLTEGAHAHGPGVGLDMQDPDGSALAVLIAARPDTETALACMGLLLEAGADVHARFGADRTTALHVAATSGWGVAGIQALVAAGANPNAGDRQGNTPLHALMTPPSIQRSAFWEHRGDLIEGLVAAWVAAGANPNARNKEGETPLDRVFLTKKSGRMDAAEKVLRTGVLWTRRATRLILAEASSRGFASQFANKTRAKALIAQGTANNLAHRLVETTSLGHPSAHPRPRM